LHTVCPSCKYMLSIGAFHQVLACNNGSHLLTLISLCTAESPDQSPQHRSASAPRVNSWPCAVAAGVTLEPHLQQPRRYLGDLVHGVPVPLHHHSNTLAATSCTVSCGSLCRRPRPWNGQAWCMPLRTPRGSNVFLPFATTSFSTQDNYPSCAVLTELIELIQIL
jgi:hypothetical protein